SGWDENRYAEEIFNAKKKIGIPVIASINCYTDKGWVGYAKKMEEAGADAIEMNVSCPHGSITFSGKDVEEAIYKTAALVRGSVKLPLIVKLSPQLTYPPEVVAKIEALGINAVTMFNRMTGLEIDVKKEEPIMHGGYAGHGGSWAINYPLRWISGISPLVKIEISGSGGVFSPEDVVKYLLCGAKTVQICSTVVLNGYKSIRKLNDGLLKFMQDKHYGSIDDFRGKITQRIKDSDAIDRSQKVAAEIDTSKCNKCGKCKDVCIYFAVDKSAEAFGIDKTKCCGCGLCAETCKQRCINMTGIA
ncbi:MAG: dihydroorotate dehydrogenase, partial [Candidatus Firestonebacteria bacterium]